MVLRGITKRVLGIPGGTVLRKSNPGSGTALHPQLGTMCGIDGALLLACRSLEWGPMSDPPDLPDLPADWGKRLLVPPSVDRQTVITIPGSGRSGHAILLFIFIFME